MAGSKPTGCVVCGTDGSRIAKNTHFCMQHAALRAQELWVCAVTCGQPKDDICSYNI